MEAFGAIKFQNANAPVEISSIVPQILILKDNPAWNYSIRFVYSLTGFQLAPFAPENQEPEIHDFVYEDYLDVEDGVVVMQA
ncbi:hypothetical protein DCAR_0830651 [Daucus carota subsp. sativus]|uniref:Uncharacterized protein n=1 Tax=Daucus carota subsp. sativus TaxID=79200 RepID=A0A175YL82_DAUCS|nr:hypothetical protein DCAR_0830651 [Daucus carota subsp. sativus]